MDQEKWSEWFKVLAALAAGPRIHSPKPKMRQIGVAHGWCSPVWMCWSSTHAAVEPTAEAAYRRWEEMV